MGLGERLRRAAVGQPTKTGKPVAAAAAILLLALAWIGFASGGRRQPELMDIALLGVIVAAFHLGAPGGLAAGVVTTVIVSPLGPLNPGWSTPRWITMGTLAMFIGSGAGARSYLLDRSYAESSHMARQLANSHQKTLHLIAEAIELRDPITAGHSQRVAVNAQNLGAKLGLADRDLDRLYWAGLLHDVGKIAIPETILQKESALSPDEWSLIREHPGLGKMLISQASPDLESIAQAVGAHHEWWNGAGYPEALLGADIPLYGRILAVIDVFDALTSDRPYRPGLRAQDALAHIEARSGTQFDPTIVPVFQRIVAGHEIIVAPALGIPTSDNSLRPGQRV